MATQNTGIEIENRMQRFERVDSFYNRLQNAWKSRNWCSHILLLIFDDFEKQNSSRFMIWIIDIGANKKRVAQQTEINRVQDAAKKNKKSETDEEVGSTSTILIESEAFCSTQLGLNSYRTILYWVTDNIAIDLWQVPDQSSWLLRGVVINVIWMNFEKLIKSLGAIWRKSCNHNAC